MVHGVAIGGNPLRVGVLAIGAEARLGLAPLVRELEKRWGAGGPLLVEPAECGDDPAAVARVIRRCTDRRRVDVVCTIGRSGHRREDFVPELTGSLLTRSLPGIEERMYLSRPNRPEDLLFRGRAGIRGRTLVVNLPARPARVRTVLAFLAAVLPHAIEKVRGSDRECGAGDGAA